MIDTKELRSMVKGAQFESFANSVINSLLDRIEAAEKERVVGGIPPEAMQALGQYILDAITRIFTEQACEELA